MHTEVPGGTCSCMRRRQACRAQLPHLGSNGTHDWPQRLIGGEGLGQQRWEARSSNGCYHAHNDSNTNQQLDKLISLSPVSQRGEECQRSLLHGSVAVCKQVPHLQGGNFCSAWLSGRRLRPAC